MALKIAIQGAAGRMGRRLIALSAAAQDLIVAAALESPASRMLGRDAGEMAGVAPLGVEISDRPTREFDVLIDFSTPAGTPTALDCCRNTRRPLVIGTTGHDAAQKSAIRAAAETIAVLHAPNMSVGVNVLLAFADKLASLLDDAYDVEITETHHRHKVDAPSGTALALRDAVAAGRGLGSADDERIIYGRRGACGPRPSGQIAVHTRRMGEVIGDHEVAFASADEIITLSHAAQSRDAFAAGALRAARWIVGKPAGLYTMQDVLFGAKSIV